MAPTLSAAAKQQLEQLISSRDANTPGVCVGVINADGNVQFLESGGPAVVGSQQPQVKQDGVFWIASCTKLVTTMACCQLLEQNKVELDMPVADLLPHLAAPELIQKAQPNPVKALHKITLRMLLTHTAGYGYSFSSDLLRDWVKEHRLDEFNGHSLPMPLIAEPGTSWNYGINLDFAGQIVEKISGLKLGDYCQKHIFEPLGVTDATFDIMSRPDMVSRLVPMHRYDPATKTYFLNPSGTPLSNHPTMHSGGAGLFTTPTDYMKILVPIINRGVGANGSRILQSDTIDLMFEDHLSAMGITKGVSEPSDHSDVEMSLGPILLSEPSQPATWGISFLLNTAQFPNGRPSGSASWTGVANLLWAAAPGKAALVVFHQILPFLEPSFVDICDKVESIVWNGLE